MQRDRVTKIGIVGGGPGGLMTAYLLQTRVNRPVEVTIFEASDRVGGKIRTLRFQSVPVTYEAGAAEFYDYSHHDEDPLKALIAELGLSITPMGGNSVCLNGQFLANLDDVQRHFGPAARHAWERFDQSARDRISPSEYFHSGSDESVPPTRPGQGFDTELKTISRPEIRQLVEVLIHSDLATEPAHTSVDYGLQNYLMNDPAYLRLYGIVGGNEQLPARLAARLHANVCLGRSVVRVGKSRSGRMNIESRDEAGLRDEEFDFVVLALPYDALSRLEFPGERLRQAMQTHLAHYNFPAHYLRITLLFSHRFWQGALVDSYCMMDQLGGCCLYDESSRTPDSTYGILGWLLGGEAAQERAAWSDERLIEEALESLPAELSAGKTCWLEGRVHRWIGAVNAIPGGIRPRPLDQRHQPEPREHRQLLVVGDYLFDSTLNGVLDSAEYVADWIAASLNEIGAAD